MFKDLDIDEKIRGERLSLEKFAQIADYVEKNK